MNVLNTVSEVMPKELDPSSYTRPAPRFRGLSAIFFRKGRFGLATVLGKWEPVISEARPGSLYSREWSQESVKPPRPRAPRSSSF